MTDENNEPGGSVIEDMIDSIETPAWHEENKQKEAALASAETAAAKPAGPATILVVDDVKYMRTLLGLNLKKKGYTVLEAEDGKEAFLIAKRQQPDLIMLDAMMPVLSGFQALNLLKADPVTKPIPVIMVTGEGDGEKVTDAIKLGVAGYIMKPFKIPEVLERVQQALHPLPKEAAKHIGNAADLLEL